ncbi:hypothetical protein WR25_15637 [Diploscapter pachys]|uniref:PIN domain-containing protein n=1 Tax=Diploscapter pachys TaxID=2018661 RepID=A0A2A2KQJ0_9BILA|nr:hypothetical protein WR25_15637 [Diploscapter pachys]
MNAGRNGFQIRFRYMKTCSESMPEEIEPSGEESAGQKQRRKRPEIQIYRPGMMKHGAPRERREHPDDASDAGSESGRPHGTYDSTQSLYTNRIPDSYLNFRRNDRLGGSARSHGQKFNRDHNAERSSMRAGDGRGHWKRDGGGRRRNDSINSTQSERPAAQRELNVDTSHETRSQVGESPSSSAMSYQEICESFESLGSFDWSKEVEMETIQRMQEEEERDKERQKQLEHRLAACSTGNDVRKELESHKRPVRGILRVTVDDRKQVNHRGNRGRDIEDRVCVDLDRCSSVSDSIVEEDDRGTLEDEDELRSGEKTPTPTGSHTDLRQNWKKNPSNQRRTEGRQQIQQNSRQRPSQNRERGRENREGYYNNQYGGEQDKGNWRKGGGRQQKERDQPPHQPQQQGRFANEHDLGRTEPPPGGSRLAGRLTIQRNADQPRQALQKNESKERGNAVGSVNRELRDSQTADPPTHQSQTASEKADSPTSSRTTKANSNQVASKETSKQTTDSDMYQQIAQKQGPKMEKINAQITDLLAVVRKKKNPDEMQRVVELSERLCELYLEFICKDIKFTFSQNLEQHCWNQAFYRPIECFRTACNSSSSQAKLLRAEFHRLLSNGIQFYNKLIDLYEKELDIRLSALLMWPKGSPPNDLKQVHVGQHPIALLTSSSKLASKSLARHMISLGNLYRYRTLLNGSADYSEAIEWYAKAAQIWPVNGNVYNLLSIAISYSMLYRSRRRFLHIPLETLSNTRQNQVIEDIFFCVRALAAGHPFELAKERLYSKLDSMANKVRQYEPKLDEEVGTYKNSREQRDELPHDGRIEVWLSMDGNEWEEKNECTNEAEQAKAVYEKFCAQEPSKLQRRTTAYVIHLFGMLLSKIGMENFSSVSERSLAQLSALIHHASSPLTALQLVQITILFIYSVHANQSKDLEPDTCSEQQQIAFRTVMTLFAALIEPLAERRGEIEQWIGGEGDSNVPAVISRTLPALVVLCEWLSCPSVSRVFKSLPSLEPLSNPLHSLDAWHMLAQVATRLDKLDEEGRLVNITANEEPTENHRVLPELNYASSFFDCFKPTPRPTSVQDKNASATALRLRHVLQCAEYLDGMDLRCFVFDRETGQFCRKDREESPAARPMRVQSSRSDDTFTGFEDELPNLSSNDGVLTRDELMERVRAKRQNIILVRPDSVVLDTNALVDHLPLIDKIVSDDRFKVLVPTIVTDELMGLSLGKQCTADSAHQEYVKNNAQLAVNWIRGQMKVKSPNVATLTTKGKKIALTLAAESIDSEDGAQLSKNNDDLIIDSCDAFLRRFEGMLQPEPDRQLGQDASKSLQPLRLAILSEDRGMCIKATSRQIPNRSIISFAKWAKIS